MSKPCTTSLINRKTSDPPSSSGEYNPPAVSYSVRVTSPVHVSFARPQKDSIKTVKTDSTEELQKEQSVLPATVNESLWSSSDRVNISVSDSRVELDMSPYFIE